MLAHDLSSKWIHILKSNGEKMKKFTTVLSTAFLGLMLSNVAVAHEAAKPMDRKAMIEMCEKMASAHQKMADCLKSDRSDKECMDEMKANCPMMKAGKTCSMMDMMNDGDAKAHDHKK